MSREVFSTLLMTPAPAVPVTRIQRTIPLASVAFRDLKGIPNIPLHRDYPACFEVAGLGRRSPESFRTTHEAAATSGFALPADMARGTYRGAGICFPRVIPENVYVRRYRFGHTMPLYSHTDRCPWHLICPIPED